MRGVFWFIVRHVILQETTTKQHYTGDITAKRFPLLDEKTTKA